MLASGSGNVASAWSLQSPQWLPKDVRDIGLRDLVTLGASGFVDASRWTICSRGNSKFELKQAARDMEEGGLVPGGPSLKEWIMVVFRCYLIF